MDNVTMEGIIVGNGSRANASAMNNTHTDELDGFSMPTYAQAVMIIMYGTVIVLAVGGNAIVVYIVLTYQRMRTVTNYFIVNLSLADIIMSVLCIPFSFIANMLVYYWPFGAIMCPIVSYAQAVAVFLSAFTMVAISLDRYVAIIYPLRPRMTTRQAAVVISLIWFLSCSVPLPIAILSRIQVDYDHMGIPRDYCLEIWPSQKSRYIYSILIMVLQYFLPLVVLTLTYARIAILIWVKKTIGETDSVREQKMASSKRKMVKMMITVVVIYALCWLPLHTLTILGDVHVDIWTFRYIQLVWIACHWLAMSNSCYNPMVYCWMNSKYRNGFTYILRFCPCVRYKEEEHGGYKMKRANTYISTMRSSVHEKKAVTTLSTCASPQKLHENKYATKICKEEIPLNHLSNGLSKTNTKWKNNKLEKGFSKDNGKNPSERALLTEENED